MRSAWSMNHWQASLNGYFRSIFLDPVSNNPGISAKVAYKTNLLVKEKRRKVDFCKEQKLVDEFHVQITTPNRLLEKVKLSFHSWSSLSSIMDAQMDSSKSSFDENSRAQSFTSLKADLRQDINRGFAFIRYLNGIFPWGKYSVIALASYLIRKGL